MALDLAIDHPAELPSEQLEAEICELAGHLSAAKCRWLLMIGEFDRREAWAVWGIHSCAHWLSWRCGVALGAAREQVRVARRLSDLPRVAEVFSRGELSYAKVRALTRVANDANEEELVELARCATAAQLERIVRAYRRVQLDGEVADANDRHGRRRLRWYWDDDGSLVFSGRASPEEGTVILAALEAGRAADVPDHDDTEEEDVSAETSPAERDAVDALVGMARLALAAVSREDRGDAAYQVVVHVDAAVVAGDGDGRCHLADGPRLPPETVRRLSCDAAVVAVTEGGDARSPLDVGRRTRIIPPALRRGLRCRDGGCRWPGCSNRRFVDGHHIVHWAQGGRTDLANVLLLCRRHHRLVHEAGYRLTSPAPGTFVFTRPDGREIPAVPPPEPLDGPTIAERHRSCGLPFDPETSRSLGEGEPFDLALTIDALLSAESRPRVPSCEGTWTRRHDYNHGHVGDAAPRRDQGSPLRDRGSGRA